LFSCFSGRISCFPLGPASNHDLFHLHLLSRWNYRREPPRPTYKAVTFNHFMWQCVFAFVRNYTHIGRELWFSIRGNFIYKGHMVRSADIFWLSQLGNADSFSGFHYSIFIPLYELLWWYPTSSLSLFTLPALAGSHPQTAPCFTLVLFYFETGAYYVA
jgi:hypothetical protein